MSNVIAVHTVQDTTLWKHLNADKSNSDAQQLASNLIKICDEAASRMKAMPAYAPQYTLHDEVHLLRTTELMTYVLGSTLSKLNAVEMGLLILAAFFHDQGMVPTAEEFGLLEKNEDFQLFRDNWKIEYPNYNQLEKHLGSHNISDVERNRLAQNLAELSNAMLTEYLRATHADSSANYIRSQYGKDARLEIQGINLAHLRRCFADHIANRFRNFSLPKVLGMMSK